MTIFVNACAGSTVRSRSTPTVRSMASAASVVQSLIVVFPGAGLSRGSVHAGRAAATGAALRGGPGLAEHELAFRVQHQHDLVRAAPEHVDEHWSIADLPGGPQEWRVAHPREV